MIQNSLLKLVRNKNLWAVCFTIIISLSITISMSLEVGPNDPSCYENGTCDFFADPFTSMLIPYQISWGDYIYPAVWGLIIFVVWMRAENPFIPAIVGLVLAVLAQGLFTDEGKLIGYGLLALAIGIAIYQIVIVRIHYPSN